MSIDKMPQLLFEFDLEYLKLLRLEPKNITVCQQIYWCACPSEMRLSVSAIINLTAVWHFVILKLCDARSAGCFGIGEMHRSFLRHCMEYGVAVIQDNLTTCKFNCNFCYAALIQKCIPINILFFQFGGLYPNDIFKLNESRRIGTCK